MYWAGECCVLGRRDSSFCLSKVLGKQSQVGQRARNSHEQPGFFLHVKEAVSFVSEHPGQPLLCFAARERAEPGPELQVVCAGGATWALEVLSPCCFLPYHGRSSERLLRGLALSLSVCT